MAGEPRPQVSTLIQLLVSQLTFHKLPLNTSLKVTNVHMSFV